MQKQYLLTAGPTPVPERVLLAMAEPVLYHRAPAFTECLKDVQEGLRWLVRQQTKQGGWKNDGTWSSEVAATVLRSVDWLAIGFEVIDCPY